MSSPYSTNGCETCNCGAYPKSDPNRNVLRLHRAASCYRDSYPNGYYRINMLASTTRAIPLSLLIGPNLFFVFFFAFFSLSRE